MFEFDSMSILAMLVIGLMGAGHCVGMCGGIVAALGFAADDQRRRWPILLSYNLGRITSYGLIGALVGLLGLFGHEYLSLGPSLRIFAGVLLILMGLYLAGWWHFLSWLERGGHGWQGLSVWYVMGLVTLWPGVFGTGLRRCHCSPRVECTIHDGVRPGHVAGHAGRGRFFQSAKAVVADSCFENSHGDDSYRIWCVEENCCTVR